MTSFFYFSFDSFLGSLDGIWTIFLFQSLWRNEVRSCCFCLGHTIVDPKLTRGGGKSSMSTGGAIWWEQLYDEYLFFLLRLNFWYLRAWSRQLGMISYLSIAAKNIGVRFGTRNGLNLIFDLDLPETKGLIPIRFLPNGIWVSTVFHCPLAHLFGVIGRFWGNLSILVKLSFDLNAVSTFSLQRIDVPFWGFCTYNWEVISNSLPLKTLSQQYFRWKFNWA